MLKSRHSYALNIHTAFFKSENGNFTVQSIENGLCKLGVMKPLAYLAAHYFMSGANLLGCPSVTFLGGGNLASADLLKLIHPFDTGIFDKQGAFDETVFARLATYAIVDQKTNQKVISLQAIQKFQKQESHHIERWKHASQKEKLIGQATSPGAFWLLFKLLSDAEIDGVAHISMARLKRFYTDGYELFCEIAEAKKLEKQAYSTPACLHSRL